MRSGEDRARDFDELFGTPAIRLELFDDGDGYNADHFDRACVIGGNLHGTVVLSFGRKSRSVPDAVLAKIRGAW